MPANFMVAIGMGVLNAISETEILLLTMAKVWLKDIEKLF